MKVEILHVADCPNVRPAWELVKRALAECGVEAEVQARLVSSRDGDLECFAGSPTILINGCDVEPTTAKRIACRIYGNGAGCPSLEALRRAITQAWQEETKRAPQE